jgi:Fe-S cluster assembly iron-binding protein IscA
MASSYKLLGQAAPSATTTTTLYTVPSATEAVISTISICNRGSAAATYRLSVRASGDTLANTHYVSYDSSVDANDTVLITAGFAVAAAHVVEVYASSADLTFSAFGMEVT